MSMTFVIPSRSTPESEEKVKVAMSSIRKVRGADDEIVVVRDCPSMAFAYNEGIRRAANERIVFMHDDVELRPSEYWSDAVLDAIFQKWPVGFLGVAGSKDMFPDGRWYIDGNRMCGACFHAQIFAPNQAAPEGSTRLPDGRQYQEWYTAYGDFGRVVVLDGVLLISTKTVLSKIGGFDEETFKDTWHYYDLDVTLRAHLAGFHNITVPLFICHLSPGSYNDKWAQTKDAFLRKWFPQLPVLLDFEHDYTVQALRHIQLGQAGPPGPEMAG